MREKLGWVAVWMVALGPAVAGADVIRPTPACPPGTSRAINTSGAIGGMGLYGHGGAPPCQPSVCAASAQCPSGQRCRLDAHCIVEREERELRMLGRRGPPDRDDPANYHMVRRTYDAGRCEEGRCPEGTRCLQVATCRPARERDATLIATSAERRWRAERAWSVGVPHERDRSAPAEAPPSEPAPTPSEATPSETAALEAAPAETEPPASARSPAADRAEVPGDSGGCAAAPHVKSSPPPVLAVLLLVGWLRRRAQGASSRTVRV